MLGVGEPRAQLPFPFSLQWPWGTLGSKEHNLYITGSNAFHSSLLSLAYGIPWLILGDGEECQVNWGPT